MHGSVSGSCTLHDRARYFFDLVEPQMRKNAAVASKQFLQLLAGGLGGAALGAGVAYSAAKKGKMSNQQRTALYQAELGGKEKDVARAKRHVEAANRLEGHPGRAAMLGALLGVAPGIGLERALAGVTKRYARTHLVLPSRKS